MIMVILFIIIIATCLLCDGGGYYSVRISLLFTAFLCSFGIFLVLHIEGRGNIIQGCCSNNEMFAQLGSAVEACC